MISTIRRSNVIISFAAGVFIFREANIKRRALLLLPVIARIGAGHNAISATRG